MATPAGNTGYGPDQQNRSGALHMSLPDNCLGVCLCGRCPTFYNLVDLSPATSACSSMQGDMSPGTIWSTKMHTQTSEPFQPALDATYFELPQTLLGMASLSNGQPSLGQAGPAFYSPGISFVDESTDPTPCSSSHSDDPFATLDPISTIASRNERRKAQNRAAQRAFRVRQQQALAQANLRMHALHEELDEAISSRNHFERLFRSLSQEHERLLEKFDELLKTVESRPSRT
ncbi:hypothetical protein CLCR_10724 [Cladophialophora carrionii]|uniref:BZIP domain-containing protein n=1 Tax=Cladophialophora carrionii TaxID=86049 RepID=A0A1C1CVF0_9EURO|nr:hypothetical protein CLCR_10724 [Cladophialophora carrionii]